MRYIHPDSVIGDNVKIGNFVEIGGTPFSLKRNSVIKEGTRMDTHVHVSHDCIIGKHCEIDPGVIILGECTIGDYSRLCTGCIIHPKTTIGSNCTVGANSYLRHDLKDNEIAYGTPAKPIQNTNYSKYRKQFSI